MKIIVGISGASSAILGVRVLQVLRDYEDIETHLVISHSGEFTIKYETNWSDIDSIKNLADYTYDIGDIGARISSGSFKTDGMIVAPCSAKTLSAVANSFGDNLLVRACDVILKERRRLVLVFRETPLHLGHIKNMERVTEMGGIILPPVPSFYHHPVTINDLVDQIVGKILDLFNIEHSLFKRWDGARISGVEGVPR